MRGSRKGRRGGKDEGGKDDSEIAWSRFPKKETAHLVPKKRIKIKGRKDAHLCLRGRARSESRGRRRAALVRELLGAWTRVRAFEEAAFVAELKKRVSIQEKRREERSTNDVPWAQQLKHLRLTRSLSFVAALSVCTTCITPAPPPLPCGGAIGALRVVPGRVEVGVSVAGRRGWWSQRGRRGRVSRGGVHLHDVGFARMVGGDSAFVGD
jgi:hypothetical protein